MDPPLNAKWRRYIRSPITTWRKMIGSSQNLGLPRFGSKSNRVWRRSHSFGIRHI
ncbi:hypothetical protein PanWU01x14_087070 [Parasponia andersonii]|uniref:Uncharacterized protein n=1 Tax=Parasponia andersonii TaxID=3476 RepID=A0A2P5D8J6_PARAD|nr:hypothetical protein PanWU01x14_087070 [Parasponia andersonii]